MAVYLVRHAVALGRAEWGKPDELRPLTKRGERQAAGLVDLLASTDVRRVLSSPAVRCRETVAPLASKLGLDVVDAPELAEGADPREALALATKLAAKSGDAVLCTHGDVIPEVLRKLSHDGVRFDGEPRWPKGSTWELRWDGTRFTRAKYHPPAD